MKIKPYGEQHESEYDKKPDYCPFCHLAVEPNHLVAIKIADNRMQVVFKCPRHECGNAFVGNYTRPSYGTSFIYILRNIYPVNAKPLSPSKEIKQVSSQFVKIYQEADIAEQYDLMEIAGIGYRKALEFLIKDYCISIYPDKEEDIKKKFITTVINEYIDNRRIKECSERAIWLGNDEAHYVKKWEDKDIKDLKILIDITVNFIQSEILAEQYSQDMQK